MIIIRIPILAITVLMTSIGTFSLVIGGFSGNMSASAANIICLPFPAQCIGTTSGDTMTGSSGNDEMFGRQGNDLMFGNGGG
jgi:Ca2+-binding RTX toxin-like protein